MQRMMLLSLANFSLFWFSQPWTLPASIYPLIVCSQNELSPSSSKDKPLFHNETLTLISELCRALTQTKVHAEMSTPVHNWKFHIWLFHTTSAVFLRLSLPLSLRAGTPGSSASRAQLKQWYGDFLILMPGYHCHFSPYLLALLFCKLKRDGCNMLLLPPFPTKLVHIVTQGFEIWVLDRCVSGTGIHQLFKQWPGGYCTCSWIVWVEKNPHQKQNQKKFGWKCTSWLWTEGH